jgi:hypothetical protein
MPELPSTQRPSKTETLADLYNNTNSRYKTSIRSHLTNRAGQMAWALSKDAGTSKAFTNAINGSPAGFPNDWASREFGGGGFTPNALQYSKNVLRHDNTPYRG